MSRYELEEGWYIQEFATAPVKVAAFHHCVEGQPQVGAMRKQLKTFHLDDGSAGFVLRMVMACSRCKAQAPKNLEFKLRLLNKIEKVLDY